MDLDVGAAKRAYGAGLVGLVRDDLRHLAPDLLRWHLPRVAPDGLLRPGLTIPLSRYDVGDGRFVHLVVRTPPAWADAGQRVSLALWDGDLAGDPVARLHPHPHPSRRFRLDLHRHLWDARRVGELAERAAGDDQHATRRWPVEAALLLAAEGWPAGEVEVRVGGGRRVVVDTRGDPAGGELGFPAREFARCPELPLPVREFTRPAALPLLPDAATWPLPDLVLLRAGAIEADGLHPLVAGALVPGYVRAAAVAGDDGHRYVDCRGSRHRIGLVGGVLSPLDHAPEELRREELLMALTGTPLPCLRVIDEAHRRPECLSGVRERLEHGDMAGALAVVEELLGPEAVLRDGPLRDALAEAAERKVAYGVYRAGLSAGAPERSLGDWTGRRKRARRYARRPVPKL
ncbi:hypothetical protein IAG44_15720 [Streptomyces roseirectus]|uniref:Uncharacterized protein n=1 Tax=Streptomyces roseirectus TaxID=2768066 RepID=A0A7H0ID71_9ACTN|nr:hypothetical protein IAG44_15720 [Streptomyces roseirectus]